MKKLSIFILMLVLSSCCLLNGCGSGKGEGTSSGGNQNSDTTNSPEEKPTGPPRDNTPHVYVPEASGTVVYGNETVTYDASHIDQGYIMVNYMGTNPKVRLQMFAPSGAEYLYVIENTGGFETFLFPAGNGSYKLRLMESTENDKYLVAFTQDIEVALADEFLPFLYPNQYVNFAPDSTAIQKGSELAKDSYSDIETVEDIYHFVVENTEYDREKAKNVSFGYRPNPDETLSTGKGICFDYASLMTTMLRSQRIPTRLEVGYAGEVYHAWISTYIEDEGWIDNIIQFDGETWSLMDPTFAASSDNETLKDFIGEGGNYVIEFTY